MANCVRRAVTLIFGSLLLAAFLGCGGGGQSTRPSKTQKQDEVENVNVVGLCKNYLADKSAADRKYRGKTVELSGTVHTAKWSPNKEEGLFVVLETGTKEFVVTAWFDKKHEKEVLGFQKGQVLRVRGKIGDVTIIKKRGEVFVSLDECVRVGEQEKAAS